MSKIKQRKNGDSGIVFLGILLLITGSVLLLNRVGFFLPRWLISWPMFFIAIGVHFGIRDNFRSLKSYFFVAFGTILLLDRVIPDYDISNFIWPLILISFGLYMILGRGKKRGTISLPPLPDLEWDKRQPESAQDVPPETHTPPLTPNDQDFIDSTSIFGGVKKSIVSKNFMGGDIVNVMGGCELNLSQADINGTVILDVTQIMGGTKIIVPPHWEIRPEMIAFLGSIEDKRPLQAQASSGKVLVIRGTSIFGGIDIKSY